MRSPGNSLRLGASSRLAGAHGESAALKQALHQRQPVAQFVPIGSMMGVPDLNQQPGVCPIRES